MFGVTAFLVVVIDNVIVVTGIIVVSVIGSASAGIWPVSVVSAVTVVALIAVIFLRWPTPRHSRGERECIPSSAS
jgi:hypothetical protein